MEIGPLKGGFKVELPQPKNKVLPPLAMRMLAIGPSSAGKSNAIVTLLTDERFYRGLFEKIYWISPTATVDPGLDILREYVKTRQDQDKDPTFHDSVDIPFLQSRLDRAKKVMEFLKKSKSKQKGFNTIFILDDVADIKRNLPAVARFVDGLAVKARHWGVSFILSTQKLKLPLISPTVRVNCTALMVWRLRNQSDLWDGLIYEYSALVSKEKLYAAYQAAVKIPYNFLFVDLLAKSVDEMFFSGFTKKFIMSDTDSEDEE